MGARDAANVLDLVLKNPGSREGVFHGFDERRKHAAKIANRRAEFNMWMGRAHEATAFKHFFTWSLLHTPIRRYFANQFSMRGIDSKTAVVTSRRSADKDG